MEKTIEIDCAPGTPRPDVYLKQVLDGTGLEIRDTVSRLFGNWTWNYTDVSDEVWEKAQPIIAERLTKLYESGNIRYASW